MSIIPSASPNDSSRSVARDELLDEYGRADAGTAPWTLSELRMKLANIRAEVLNDAADAIVDMERRNAWAVRPMASSLYAEFLRGMAAGHAPEDDGPLCTCGHGQNRHYTDNSYGAPGPIYGCYDCPTSSHLHQFTLAGGTR